MVMEGDLTCGDELTVKYAGNVLETDTPGTYIILWGSIIGSYLIKI